MNKLTNLQSISNVIREVKNMEEYMENIYRLKEYYKRVCFPLVFVNEILLENNKNVKVYLYDFKTEEELSNFKKIFQE